MNPYLKELTHLISNCAMENTYKMSWARAITEYLVTHKEAQSIHFDDNMENQPLKNRSNIPLLRITLRKRQLHIKLAD